MVARAPPPAISHGSQASGSVLHGNRGLFPSWGCGSKRSSSTQDDLDAQVHTVLSATTLPHPLLLPVDLDGASRLPASPVPVPGVPRPGMGLEKDVGPLPSDVCCQCLQALLLPPMGDSVMPPCLDVAGAVGNHPQRPADQLPPPPGLGGPSHAMVVLVPPGHYSAGGGGWLSPGAIAVREWGSAHLQPPWVLSQWDGWVARGRNTPQHGGDTPDVKMAPGTLWWGCGDIAPSRQSCAP